MDNADQAQSALAGTVPSALYSIVPLASVNAATSFVTSVLL